MSRARKRGNGEPDGRPPKASSARDRCTSSGCIGRASVSRSAGTRNAPRLAFGYASCGALRSGAEGIPESGRLDLNQRPFGPQPNALPDCATPRSPSRVSGRCVDGYWRRRSSIIAERDQERDPPERDALARLVRCLRGRHSDDWKSGGPRSPRSAGPRHRRAGGISPGNACCSGIRPRSARRGSDYRCPRP